MLNLFSFTRYTCLGASSRYRVYQYQYDLYQSGLKLFIQPLFDTSYLKFRYSYINFPYTKIIKLYLNRYFFLNKLKKNDALFVEKELFPWLPFSFEYLFLKNKKYALDFDDAIHIWYEKYPFLRNKIQQLAYYAKLVIVGNKWLLDIFSKINPNTYYIPTVIDPNRYIQKKSQKLNNLVIIGWIGTPLSQVHLDEIVKYFDDFRIPPFELWLMGTNRSYDYISNGRVRCFSWGMNKEKEFLSKLDIGIMPLVKHEFSEGKCGFKLLQYMASKVPCIASYSKANSEILENGKAGILVKNKDEWINAINNLYSNEELRISLALRGYERVTKNYSKSSWTRVLVNLLLNFLY